MSGPLDFEHQHWTRVVCPACGWATDVRDEDKLKRNIAANEAIHSHVAVCPKLAPHLEEARKLLTSLDLICIELDCTLEVLVMLSGSPVRNETIKFGRGAVNVVPGGPSIPQ